MFFLALSGSTLMRKLPVAIARVLRGFSNYDFTISTRIISLRRRQLSLLKSFCIRSIFIILYKQHRIIFNLNDSKQVLGLIIECLKNNRPIKSIFLGNLSTSIKHLIKKTKSAN